MDHTVKMDTFTPNDTKLAKGLAILLMLGHHLFAFPERLHAGVSYHPLFYLWGLPVEQQFGIFGKLCVAIFLVLAGYGTYLSLHKVKDMVPVIIKKLKNLYCHYWKIFIVFIPLGMILGRGTISKYGVEIFYNVTALRISFNGEWWFLTPYIALILLFPILVHFTNRKKNNWIIDLFWIVILATGIVYFLPQIESLSFMAPLKGSVVYQIIILTLRQLPSFLMGMILAKYQLIVKFWNLFQNKLTLKLGSFALCLLIFYLRSQVGENVDYLFAPIFIACGVALLKDMKFINHGMALLGNRSTDIWLIHGFFCYYFFQSFIYAPKLSILILPWLLFWSYLSGWVIEKLFYYLNKGWKWFSHQWNQKEIFSLK